MLLLVMYRAESSSFRNQSIYFLDYIQTNLGPKARKWANPKARATELKMQVTILSWEELNPLIFYDAVLYFL